MSRKTKAAKAYDLVMAYGGHKPERGCTCDWCVVWAALNPKPKKRAKKAKK